MTRKPARRPEGLQLYDARGRRKYLTPEERKAFLAAAESAPREVRTFCLVLAYTGCRISEALALTAGRVDPTDGVIVLETLKKRRSGVYRALPVPRTVLGALDLVHDIREAQKGRGARACGCGPSRAPPPGGRWRACLGQPR
jgi:integrase